MADPIRYWDSQTGCEETETVYGGWGVRALYGSGLGARLGLPLLTHAVWSRAYGGLQSTAWSARKITAFVRRYGIDLTQFEVPVGGYASFNDFFVRKFKPGVRAFDSNSEVLPAFAEARYLGWESVTREQVFPVKGRDLTASALLGAGEVAGEFAADFEGGPVLIARLCPVDYHRYHYPDAGTTMAAWDVPGAYHSVNPWALRARGELFSTNRRRVSILETQNFGRLGYVEVGAMGVGRIVQSHDEKLSHRRGDEKGYFLFGGSTVILLGEQGRWKPESLILENTAAKREVWMPLGKPVGRKT